MEGCWGGEGDHPRLNPPYNALRACRSKFSTSERPPVSIALKSSRSISVSKASRDRVRPLPLPAAQASTVAMVALGGLPCLLPVGAAFAAVLGFFDLSVRPNQAL